MFSCEDDQIRESEDCAGVTGGDNVCGCTDDQAMNFDSTATFDDGSCDGTATAKCEWRSAMLILFSCLCVRMNFRIKITDSCGPV